MNTRLYAFALLGLLAAGGARAETYRESFSETRPLSPGGAITLDNTNGAVEIRTWDRNEVAITGEKSASDPDILKELQVEIDSTASSLRIKGVYPQHHLLGFWHWGESEEIHFTLTVPAGAKLDGIRTTNGSVTIENCSGPVTASTVNGSVRVTGLRGDVTLSTVNGAVRAEFTAMSPSSHLGFRTVNGSISVALPKNAGASVEASTINGGVTCDLPIQIRESHRSHLDGTIGDGSSSLEARTVNGAIHLQAL